jgi:hypothetical protein
MTTRSGTFSMSDNSPLAVVFEEWDRRTRAAVDWLVVSWEQCDRTGSAAHYSPLFGWSAPYPETTGYIIPTLWRAADRFAEPRYAAAAEEMTRWLLTLQAREGWFPGGVWNPDRIPRPSMFNTGQILFGLLEAARRTDDWGFRSGAERAAAWLAREQDADGRWRRHAYRDGYSPSYAHVCGRTVRCEAISRDSRIDGHRCRSARTHLRLGFAPQGLHPPVATRCGGSWSALLLDEWDRFALRPSDPPAAAEYG